MTTGNRGKDQNKNSNETQKIQVNNNHHNGNKQQDGTATKQLHEEQVNEDSLIKTTSKKER